MSRWSTKNANFKARMSEGNFKDRSYSSKKVHSPKDACFFCRCYITKQSGVDMMDRETVDHLQPKSQRGIRSLKNKVRSCFKCNQLKGEMTVEQFSIFMTSYQKVLTMNYKKETAYVIKVQKSLTYLQKNKRQ